MIKPIGSPAIVTSRKTGKAAPSVAMQAETAQSSGDSPATSTTTATKTTTAPSRASQVYAKDIAEMVQDFLILAEKDWPAENDPWIPVAQRTVPPTQVFRLENTINCFKVVAELETSPENAFDILADIRRRTEWDELCEHGVVLESLDAGCKIDYMKTKGKIASASSDRL